MFGGMYNIFVCLITGPIEIFGEVQLNRGTSNPLAKQQNSKQPYFSIRSRLAQFTNSI